MKPWPPAAIVEVLLLGAIAAAAGITMLSDQHQERDLPRALVSGQIDAIAVSHANGQFALLLAGERPLLASPNFVPTGRMLVSEADHLRQALADAEIISVIEPSELADGGLAAYGLMPGVRLERPGHAPLVLAPAAGSRAYLALEDGAVAIVDRDLATLFARSPEALREPSLSIPAAPAEVSHDRGWRMTYINDRWWRGNGPGPSRAQWADQAGVEAWLQLLNQSSSVSRVDDPGVPARARLEIIGGDGHSVVFEDLGPTTNGQRMLRRSEVIDDHRVVETMISDLDGVLLDPTPQAFAPRQLFPLDPGLATELIIGPLHCRRVDAESDWFLIDGSPLDGDHMAAITTALAQLAPNPNAGTVAADAPIVAAVAVGSLRCETRTPHPDLERLASVEAWRLFDRRLLAGVSPDEVTGLVITPQRAAPEIYSRDSNGDWPAEDASDISYLVEGLCQARVSDWHQPRVSEDNWDATITVATNRGTSIRLRLAADGRVGVIERQLSGQLDNASFRALMGGE